MFRELLLAKPLANSSAYNPNITVFALEKWFVSLVKRLDLAIRTRQLRSEHWLPKTWFIYWWLLYPNDIKNMGDGFSLDAAKEITVCIILRSERSLNWRFTKNALKKFRYSAILRPIIAQATQTALAFRTSMSLCVCWNWTRQAM